MTRTMRSRGRRKSRIKRACIARMTFSDKAHGASRLRGPSLVFLSSCRPLEGALTNILDKGDDFTGEHPTFLPLLSSTSTCIFGRLGRRTKRKISDLLLSTSWDPGRVFRDVDVLVVTEVLVPYIPCAESRLNSLQHTRVTQDKNKQ